jgi:hypothetical protein
MTLTTKTTTKAKLAMPMMLMSRMMESLHHRRHQ